MYIPICTLDRVEMECLENATMVFYPIAQRFYMSDLWGCPTCKFVVCLRAPMPAGDVTHPSYYAVKADAEVKMWNR